MSGTHQEAFPRPVLWAAAGLVGFALVGTLAVSSGLLPQVARPEAVRAERGATVVAAADLRFLDGPDGSVIVETMDGRQLTAVEAFSENGFIRGVMRGMARERGKQSVGKAAPFRLTLWSDSSLTLSDGETGREVELSGFGATNRQSFIDLLVAARPATGARSEADA